MAGLTQVGDDALSMVSLHLGNARTALLAWLWARGEGGRFLLRIEDLDPQRSRPLIIERLLEHLAAIGIDWDGNPVWQSQRSALYERALETLDAARRRETFRDEPPTRPGRRRARRP